MSNISTHPRAWYAAATAALAAAPTPPYTDPAIAVVRLTAGANGAWMTATDRYRGTIEIRSATTVRARYIAEAAKNSVGDVINIGHTDNGVIVLTTDAITTLTKGRKTCDPKSVIWPELDAMSKESLN